LLAASLIKYSNHQRTISLGRAFYVKGIVLNGPTYSSPSHGAGLSLKQDVVV
jgi:hypothetical protein